MSRSQRAGAAVGPRQALSGLRYDAMSVDSQFAEDVDDELSFLEACIDCDDDALYEIIQNGVTWDQVNERDKSGRVSVLLGTFCRFALTNDDVEQKLTQLGKM